jgi:hypothetical protein
MAFLDLDEALEELGHSGSWQNQTEAVAARQTENSVNRWREKGKFIAHFPEVKARSKIRRRASYLRNYVRRPRDVSAPRCHPDLPHKAHGLCWRCYRMTKNSGEGRFYWHLPAQIHRRCYAWELLEQKAATRLAHQRAEKWA